MAVAQVDWAMDSFVETFHGGLAHLYPLLADNIGDILLRYNISMNILKKSIISLLSTIQGSSTLVLSLFPLFFIIKYFLIDSEFLYY